MSKAVCIYFYYSLSSLLHVQDIMVVYDSVYALMNYFVRRNRKFGIKMEYVWIIISHTCNGILNRYIRTTIPRPLPRERPARSLFPISLPQDRGSTTVCRKSGYDSETIADMAKEGNKIPDLTKRRVREQLADETDPKAIKRLTAAREYLEGISPADI